MDRTIGAQTAGLREVRTHRAASFEKAALEEQAIALIKKHRQSLVSDQLVYDAWVKAADDPFTPTAVLETLADQYREREQASVSSQRTLAEMFEVLGYVPTVEE